MWSVFYHFCFFNLRNDEKSQTKYESPACARMTGTLYHPLYYPPLFIRHGRDREPIPFLEEAHRLESRSIAYHLECQRTSESRPISHIHTVPYRLLTSRFGIIVVTSYFELRLIWMWERYHLRESIYPRHRT